MEKLTKEERDLLYRLVNRGVTATLEEIDEAFIDKDVLTKHQLIQRFDSLEKKGMIEGTLRDEDNWFVDIYGMLNIAPPLLTEAGENYFTDAEATGELAEFTEGAEQRAISLAIQDLGAGVRERGGEDTEELRELWEELQELIANVEQTRQIIRNRGFVRRLNRCRIKHNWFWEATLMILGQLVLNSTAATGRTEIDDLGCTGWRGYGYAGLMGVDSCSR